MFIVIYGNPIDGISFVGPFADNDEANTFADNSDGDWWVSSIDAPPDGMTTVFNDVRVNRLEDDMNSARDIIIEMDDDIDETVWDTLCMYLTPPDDVVA